MQAAWKWGLGAVFSMGGLFLLNPGEAEAQCCAPPPPPCCTPPAPPTPPSPPCCMVPGHSVNVPSVNVYVGANVVVNANASANATVNAGASGVGSGRVLVYGGGGSGFAGGLAAQPVSMISGLNVEGGREMKRVAYEATRSKTTRVVIQAFCLDDKEVPHPASQVFPEREVDLAYEGELYRCLAGARMQWHYAEYLERVSFDGAKITTCGKNQALWRSRDGKLECRTQTAARDCNERSLLRRFGAGVKILTLTVVETYTAYREEMTESSSFSGGSLQLNGGVGGIAY